MRKFIILIAIVGMFPFRGMAQFNDTKIHIGIAAGSNISHFNFKKGYPPSNIDVQWKPGVSGGFYTQIVLSKNFSIRQSYAFLQMNALGKNPKVQYNLNYLSLPLAFQINLLPRLKVEAGGQFNILISANMTLSEEEKREINHHTEARNIGMMAGMEFQISEKTKINAAFVHSFNHIDILYLDEVKEFKSEMVQLSLLIDLFKE